MTPQFAYVAWFIDLNLPPDDQDYEWPACFIVEAVSADEALRWGNHLSMDYSKRTFQPFLRSEAMDLNVAEGDWSSEPVVPTGYEATDDEIGW